MFLHGAIVCPLASSMMHPPIEHSALSAWRFHSSATTHPGAVHRHNEDSYVNRPDLGLWAVADGAGGHQAGDVASRIIADALNAVPNGFTGAELLVEVRRRIARAHDAMWKEASRRGPHAIVASTVVALLARYDYYACLWAGDSRAYLLRGERFRQLTRDHSLVQKLFEAGAISAAEALHHPAAHIITRAVGAEHLELDKVTDRLFVGDRFLLCSDGLFKTLPEHELAELLAADEDAPAERLLFAALEGRADDNVTAVTIEVVAEPDFLDRNG
jgi:protein phosphatase/serine/threonine-protein phosphatase Stp1